MVIWIICRQKRDLKDRRAGILREGSAPVDRRPYGDTPGVLPS